MGVARAEEHAVGDDDSCASASLQEPQEEGYEEELGFFVLTMARRSLAVFS